ncbi:hypothetical protein CRUP_033436, partial [Coryphaenoides rupestris]
KPEKWILIAVNNTGLGTPVRAKGRVRLSSSAQLRNKSPFYLFVILCHHGQLSGRGTSLICTPSDCSAKMLLFLHLVFLCVAVVGSTTPSTPEDCVRSNGGGYKGNTNVSSTGLTCLAWRVAREGGHDVQNLVDSEPGVGELNYCRNPDSSEGPWCYIRAPDGSVQRQSCSIEPCKEGTASPAEVAAVQPVMGISQRVRTSPKKKKDLGTLGYVLGILMIAIIIVLGAGITFGYFFKRGQDLKKKHEQRVYEREMQRITLPLSAFSNPTCELVDENTIVVTVVEQDPAPQEVREGGEPLMGQQAGTPGA